MVHAKGWLKEVFPPAGFITDRLPSVLYDAVSVRWCVYVALK